MLIQLLIIQIVTFLALIIILRLLFYRHLNSALKRLKDLQEDALKKEAQMKEELERAKLERTAEVERGREEAKVLVDEAKQEADAIRLKAESQAKLDSQKIILAGKDELEKLKASLIADIEGQALNLSLEMIKYTFSERGKESLQHHLIDELITEIENIDKEKFSVKADKALVSSSVALTDVEKIRLENALARKLGYEIMLEQGVDPELISGLVVKMGEFVIDGSLCNKLKKVVPYLNRAES